MKIRTSLPLLAALALPALLAFHPRGDAVSFQPEDGSRLTKELELDLTFHLEDLSVSMNGQELPPEMMGGDMDEALLVNAVIGVTDEYVSSRPGKHVELLRTYDELSLEGGAEGATESAEGFDDFEGATVRFKWDEEESDYVVTLEDGEADDSALEELSVDMDLLPLLPDGEVDVDDTWTASGEELASVFLPGGMAPLPGDDENEEMTQLVEDELGTQLEEAFKEFEITCTYRGSREEDGARVGEIALSFEGEVSLDLSDLISSIADMQSGEAGVDFSADVVATVDMEFKGEGTLLWNLGAHRPHGFTMSSEMTILADVEADIEAMGESQSIALSAEVSGEGTWTMTTSAP